MSVEWADDPKKTERGPVDGPKKINRAGLKNGRRSSRGRPRHADRPFVEAMMWIARTGSPWRDLPESYPNWRSVYTRWRRWVRQALWSKILALLTTEHDPESYAVDATYVRVHAHGTRARGGYLREAIGRSRGGLTSKVHLLTDALGYPVRFVVTGGERNDITQAPALIPAGSAEVICDRGYDADWWRERLVAAGHRPVRRRASSRARRQRQCTACRRCLLWWRVSLCPVGRSLTYTRRIKSATATHRRLSRCAKWITTTRDPQSLLPLA